MSEVKKKARINTRTSEKVRDIIHLEINKIMARTLTDSNKPVWPSTDVEARQNMMMNWVIMNPRFPLIVTEQILAIPNVKAVLQYDLEIFEHYLEFRLRILMKNRNRIIECCMGVTPITERISVE